MGCCRAPQTLSQNGRQQQRESAEALEENPEAACLHLTLAVNPMFIAKMCAYSIALCFTTNNPLPSIISK